MALKSFEKGFETLSRIVKASHALNTDFSASV